MMTGMVTQRTFNCSKLTIEILEKGVKHVSNINMLTC